MSKRPRQRFNHVGLSVPPDAIDADGREEIGAFFQEVFGWVPIPEMTKDREQFVMMAHAVDQFVFLIADDTPMQAPRLDHFGLAVEDPEEFDSIIERARRYAEKDERVDIIEPNVENYGPVTIHSYYIGYLLPMMVEIQRWEFVDDQAD